MSTLDLRIVRPAKPFADGDLDGITSEAKAIAAMCERSGLSDKAIAIEINVDPALLSKAQSGQARLSEAAILRLMDLSGSLLWLHYWPAKRGFDPHSVRPIESEVEAQNRKLREEIEQMKRERDVEIRLLKEIRAAA